MAESTPLLKETTLNGQIETGTDAPIGQLQDNRVEFERISLEQGLSQSVVLCSLQDSMGFMWFCTQDGLNRYDGYEFVVYKHDPENPNTLSDSFVWSILEDPPGTLWIGTNGGGLDRYDRATGKFTHYQNDPTDPQSLSSNVVLALYQDRQGLLWVGTDDGGLNRFDRETGQFVRYQNDPNDPHSLSSNTVQAILEDQQGLLWLGTDGGGLSRFDREAGVFANYQHDPSDPHSLSGNSVLAVHEDREGVLWVGTTDAGLNSFDRDTGQFTHYQNDPNDPHSLGDNAVWSIYQDREGVLWVGTFAGGLDRFDRETGQFIHYYNKPNDPQSLSSNQIISVYEDPLGVLWFGSFGGGVNRFDREKEKFLHYRADADEPNSLSESMVFSFLEDQEGTLWIGTGGGGLNRLDRTTGQFVHYRNVPADVHGLSDDLVWSIFQDREGVIWVGTGSGLDRFDRKTEQFDHYPTWPVFSIQQDSQGALWLGTWDGGLGRFDAQTEQLVFYETDPADGHSLSDNSVVSVYEDREGVLWVGTFSGGLNRYDREAERFVRYQNDPGDPSSLSHNTVLAIHQDREGVLWVATAGGGLNKFDRVSETFASYREKDGLPNDTVYGILEDAQGNLWLSTNRGVSKFDPRTERFRNYDVGDGLQSDEFNQGAYYQSRGGEMFFGGVNGFNAFYPEQIADNPHIPPIVLTALRQAGQDVDAGATPESATAVAFTWPRNFFEFEFAALSYAQPEKNQYAYMLKGFDPDWIETGTRRFGQYTNLPGGTYTLRIRGSNNDGIWNEEGLSLEVTIVPPFWRTWWFQGILALVLLAGAFGGYRLRVRSVEARSRELEAQVGHRTRELEALNAVTSVVSRSLDLQEILNDALAMTLQVTDMEGGGIYLLDEKAGTLALAAHQGFSPEFVDEIDGLRVGEGFSGRVVESGQPLAVRDLSADASLTRMVAREEGFHSLVSVPLSSKGKVLGTMFAMTHNYREFTDQDIQLLISIGHQIGVALENGRLYEDANARLAQLTALQETTGAVVSTLDLDRLLNLIIQQATTLLRADGGIVNLVDWEKQEDEVVAASGSATSLLGHRSPLQGSLSGWTALHNEAIISNQLSSDSRVSQPALRWMPAAKMQGAAVAPLTIKEQVMGTLVVIGSREERKGFAQPDLDLLVAFANQAATAIENAQLLEAERQRADELDALRTTMADVTAELELSALLRAIVERAAGLLHASGGELGLLDEASQELRIVVSHNLGKDYVGTRHKLGEGAMGRVAQTAESLIIPDYHAWQGALAEYPQVHATLAVPLKVGSRLVGVFSTVSTEPDRKFTAADRHLLDLFAQQAAIAIENARLYEQARQLAAVEERQRLARNLHDSVTQALYGVTLYSEAVSGQLSQGQIDRAAEHLRELQNTAREALAEMRLLIYELRPPVLEEEGLIAALQARLAAVEERVGVKTEFIVEGEGRLPPEVEEGLYRIGQEALNNAMKHAQASNIRVCLRQAEASVTLEIADDGVGFDPSTAGKQGGLGLQAMEERAAELGGQLSLRSRPQGGTQILVEVFL